MRFECKVRTVNRNPGGRSGVFYKKSTIALGKETNTDNDYFMLHFSNVVRGSLKGSKYTKYPLKCNPTRVFTKCINEGRITVSFEDPQHDLFIQADPCQLSQFVDALNTCLAGEVGALLPCPLIVAARERYNKHMLEAHNTHFEEQESLLDEKKEILQEKKGNLEKKKPFLDAIQQVPDIKKSIIEAKKLMHNTNKIIIYDKNPTLDENKSGIDEIKAKLKKNKLIYEKNTNIQNDKQPIQNELPTLGEIKALADQKEAKQKKKHNRNKNKSLKKQKSLLEEEDTKTNLEENKTIPNVMKSVPDKTSNREEKKENHDNKEAQLEKNVQKLGEKQPTLIISEKMKFIVNEKNEEEDIQQGIKTTLLENEKTCDAEKVMDEIKLLTEDNTLKNGENKLILRKKKRGRNQKKSVYKKKRPNIYEEDSILWEPKPTPELSQVIYDENKNEKVGEEEPILDDTKTMLAVNKVVYKPFFSEDEFTSEKQTSIVCADEINDGINTTLYEVMGDDNKPIYNNDEGMTTVKEKEPLLEENENKVIYNWKKTIAYDDKPIIGEKPIHKKKHCNKKKSTYTKHHIIIVNEKKKTLNDENKSFEGYYPWFNKN